jgi:heme-degrading monooxygenase HmoA
VILRVFRVKVAFEHHHRWRDQIKHEVMPALSRVDGLLAFYAGEPIEDAEDEFTMVTLWRDLEAVRAFAGADWHEAVFHGEEAELAQDVTVEHFRVFGSRA